MARGVAAGTGAASRAGIGAAIAAFVGAGMSAIIGYVRGAIAGASIAAGLQKCEEVFLYYMEEDINWEEHGRYIVYKVKYRYKYPE